LKSNTDFGVFLPVQKAGVRALNCDRAVVKQTAKAYERRRDLLVTALCDAGWYIELPKATMFVWAKIPPTFEDDAVFAQQLRERTGVIVVPGSAFGQSGKGFVRMALVQSDERITEAAGRIKAFLDV